MAPVSVSRMAASMKEPWLEKSIWLQPVTLYTDANPSAVNGFGGIVIAQLKV